MKRCTIVDLRINEIVQTGAVGNRTYRVGLNAVRLGIPIHRDRPAPTGDTAGLFGELKGIPKPVRLKTAPTGVRVHHKSLELLNGVGEFA